LLALIGVFGMTSYAVSQRTREIGVRVALGATTRDVLTAVGGSASAAIAIGVIVGAGATLWAGRAIASFLYNVTPWDPISLAAAALTLAVAAALAAYLPARRALRVDPVNALREQ
jgi:putative ABC transport system permease protein